MVIGTTILQGDFMRFLSLILMLAATACAVDEPVSLYDGMGEVDADRVITLDQIDFNDQGVSFDQIESCLDYEDVERGVKCDTEHAVLHFDADIWTLQDNGLLVYDMQPIDYSCTPDGKICGTITVTAVDRPPSNTRWAECGCPSGCSATDCRWEQSEESNKYLCEGDCRGSHCSECNVLLTDAPVDTSPTS
jgi:hypothetical protein